MRIMALFVLALALGSCVTEAGVDERYADKLTAWVASNPQVELTEAVKQQLYKEAAKEVEVEVAAKRDKALGHTQGAIGAALSGNFITAGFHVFGLLGLGLGLVKTKKKEAVPA